MSLISQSEASFESQLAKAMKESEELCYREARERTQMEIAINESAILEALRKSLEPENDHSLALAIEESKNDILSEFMIRESASLEETRQVMEIAELEIAMQESMYYSKKQEDLLMILALEESRKMYIAKQASNSSFEI